MGSEEHEDREYCSRRVSVVDACKNGTVNGYSTIDDLFCVKKIKERVRGIIQSAYNLRLGFCTQVPITIRRIRVQVLPRARYHTWRCSIRTLRCYALEKKKKLINRLVMRLFKNIRIYLRKVKRGKKDDAIKRHYDKYRTFGYRWQRTTVALEIYFERIVGDIESHKAPLWTQKFDIFFFRVA